MRTQSLVLAAGSAALALAAAGCGGAAETCAPVESPGPGEPSLVIASDLPLRGPAGRKGRQIAAAIRFELGRRGWKAGGRRLGYLSCDQASSSGEVEPRTCSSNANRLAGTVEVVGVIGPLDSSCAQIQIPVLNQSPDGAIALVSPSNTFTCLTRAGPGCDVSEPDKYYPSGTRNYLRLAPHDLYQAAAAAELAKSIAVENVYVLDDDEAYGVGMGAAFRNAAEALGIEIAGSSSWDAHASGYRPLFEQIRRTGADAIFLAGLVTQNGRRLIADKVAVLGPNDGPVRLLGADGFVTEETIAAVGEAVRGMLAIAPGVALSALGAPAKELAAALRAGPLGGTVVDPYAIHGAEAARLLLDAIATSDGTRSSVIAQLFQARVTDGLLGSFRFDEQGDPVDADGAVVGFTVYRATGAFEAVRTVTPRQETVRAAGGR